MVEVEVSEAMVKMRHQVALAAASVAIAAHRFGLAIGSVALVESSPDEVDVACDLLDQIEQSTATEETISLVALDLLAQYALIIGAGEQQQWYSACRINQIASRIVAATFPRPLESRTRKAKSALERMTMAWTACVDEDAWLLVREMDVQIQIVANAICESGSLSAEDMQQLLSRVCIRRAA